MKTSYSSKSPMYKTRAVTNRKQNNYLSSTTAHPLPILGGTVLTADGVIGSLQTNVPGRSVASIPGNQVEVEAGTLDSEKQPNEPLLGMNTDENFVKKDSVPVLLNEPSKLESPPLSDDNINQLNGENWLSVEFIDFLLKQGLPYWVPADVIIPTCNVDTLFNKYNKKAESTLPEDLQFVKNKCAEYKYFANKVLRIFTFTLQKGHYFVLDMIVVCSDAEGDFIQSVTVYNSLLRSGRVSNKKN